MAKVPGSGRQKGTPNKRTEVIEEIAQRLGVVPFEVLCMIVGDKWKELGATPLIKKETDNEGNVIKVIEYSPITVDQRMYAAREACKYLYPQKRAIVFSDDKPLVVRVEDYTTKVESK